MPNALVVFAHPEARSFCGALKDRATAALRDAGYDVAVSDLYAIGWKPGLDQADFPDSDYDRFDPSAVQEVAYATGDFTVDVLAEQRKLEEADLLVFHFPVWWFSMPAILKGWVDRVFARGFAYSAGRKYDLGHFTGKRAMLCVTTGTAAETYEPAGVDGDLLHVLWPIHNGILAYAGFTVLPPFAAFAPARMDEDERVATLEALDTHIRSLDGAGPLYFHPSTDYDRTWKLKPDVVARSGVQWNPAAGQGRVDAAAQYTPPARTRATERRRST